MTENEEHKIKALKYLRGGGEIHLRTNVARTAVTCQDAWVRRK